AQARERGGEVGEPFANAIVAVIDAGVGHVGKLVELAVGMPHRKHRLHVTAIEGRKSGSQQSDVLVHGYEYRRPLSSTRWPPPRSNPRPTPCRRSSSTSGRRSARWSPNGWRPARRRSTQPRSTHGTCGTCSPS